jgi:ectoine hydroxylase-related dioxygenase (phytanoyl-CoA dioxygenase family)
MTVTQSDAATSQQTNVLTPEQVAFYQEHGYLHLPGVFTEAETAELRADLDWMLSTWAYRHEWTGGWRHELMDAETEKQAKIDIMHDLQLIAGSWARATAKPNLAGAMSDLLGGGPVELHHSTMHVKPPETGMPFPMHQDFPFYQHTDGRYVDCLFHLDDTSHENGEIRFLPGSHKHGALNHIDVSDGVLCTPYLPTDQYRLEDTVAVPAKAGDVVCFSIHTIHGSHINTTSEPRRLVRVGYRHPDNVQLAGQSAGRAGPIVWGRRPRPASTAP